MQNGYVERFNGSCRKDALKNTCLTGRAFRTEHRESWSNGEKDGDWIYYDPNGNELIRMTYERGKRVR